MGSGAGADAVRLPGVVSPGVVLVRAPTPPPRRGREDPDPRGEPRTLHLREVHEGLQGRRGPSGKRNPGLDKEVPSFLSLRRALGSSLLLFFPLVEGSSSPLGAPAIPLGPSGPRPNRKPLSFVWKEGEGPGGFKTFGVFFKDNNTKNPKNPRARREKRPSSLVVVVEIRSGVRRQQQQQQRSRR